MKINNLFIAITAALLMFACGNANNADDKTTPEPEEKVVNSEGVIFTADAVSGETVDIVLYDNYLKALVEDKITEDFEEEEISGPYEVRFQLRISNLSYFGDEIGTVECEEDIERPLDFGKVTPQDLWQENYVQLANNRELVNCIGESNNKRYIVEIYKIGTNLYNQNYVFTFDLEHNTFTGVIYIKTRPDEKPGLSLVF
ncbi:MAG: hypothetical protein JXA66_08815 [Oligoflexia bacterium]|nr:hypothetical protein [Oligoflexia bacterium]